MLSRGAEGVVGTVDDVMSPAATLPVPVGSIQTVHTSARRGRLGSRRRGRALRRRLLQS